MLPLTFIVLYAINEYLLPTRNSAMLASICGAILFSYIYYTIRTKVSQRAKKKKQHLAETKRSLTLLMLVDKSSFNECFKDSLADNSFTGIDEDKLIHYLRKNGLSKHIDIYSVNGMTSGCIQLLSDLNISYTIHSSEKIIDLTSTLTKPAITTSEKSSRLNRIKKAFTSKEFGKFAIKYGVILCFFALITPYKVYYTVFGISLFLWGIFLKICSINQRNQIPYPRS
jgi:hypothetical protein